MGSQKFERKIAAFKQSAGWNIAVVKPPKLYTTGMDKKRLQSRLRTMSDSEIDALLKE